MRPVPMNTVQLDGRGLGGPLLQFAPLHGGRTPQPTHSAEIYMLDRSELRQTLAQIAASLHRRWLAEPAGSPDGVSLQP